MKHNILAVYFLFLLLGCTVKPREYSPTTVPPPPDYADPEAWAALPSRNDPADLTPNGQLTDRQSSAQIDVFFLHPTTYVKRGDGWNAPVSDEKLNRKTDLSTIKYQASIFNGAGRIYAPRYRQAHMHAFRTDDEERAEAAFEIAYSDLKAAFQYYLDHFNQKRPIIIAAHSQGSRHGIRLLREFFDDKPLGQRLVVAYIVGWPVRKDEYQTIPPCQSPAQTGCICSWRSFRNGYIDSWYATGDSILVTNPLTWKTDGEYGPKTLHDGAVLRNFNKVYPGIVDAQPHNGILWINKPKFPGSIFFNRRNYHIADYNLFYLDVRENAKRREEAFWK